MTTLRLATAALMLSALPALAGSVAFDLPRLDFGTQATASTAGSIAGSPAGAPAPVCTAAPCPAAK